MKIKKMPPKYRFNIHKYIKIIVSIIKMMFVFWWYFKLNLLNR